MTLDVRSKVRAAVNSNLIAISAGDSCAAILLMAPSNALPEPPAPQLFAADEDFGRVHHTAVGEVGECTLSCSEARIAKAVFPAEIIPVVDMQGERHNAVGIGLRADLG